MTFANDPFGYKQHEEQYITNPNDVILFNYGASIPKPKQSKQLSVIFVIRTISNKQKGTYRHKTHNCDL